MLISRQLNTEMEERAVLIRQRNDNRNTVWSHMALVLNNPPLMYIKNNCVGNNDYGDRMKAWKLLQEKSCYEETPTGVSLINQFVKLHPISRRMLGLPSRADDAVDRNSRSNHGNAVQ